MNRDEYTAALIAIGHFHGAVIHTKKDRWRGECECGYVSATRVNAREAIGAIEHHRKKALADARKNGREIHHKAASGL